MAVSSSDVEIRINVVDTSSGEVIADLTNQFTKLGDAGAANGRKLGEGLGEAGKQGKEAKEQLHLLSEEVGIHIPKAFRGIVTGSSTARAALIGLSGVLATIGTVQLGAFIFEEVISKAREFYDEFLNVNKVVREYQEHARQAAKEKLFDEGSIQTQLAMVANVNREMDELIKKQREASGVGSFVTSLAAKYYFGANRPYFSPEDQKKLNEAQTDADKANLAGIEREREERLAQLRNRESLETAAAPEYARGEVARRFDYQRSEVGQEFDQRRDRVQFDIYNRGETERAKEQHRAPNYQYLPNDAGWQEKLEAQQAADVKYKAGEIERERENAQEIRRLEDQARQASLHGIGALEDQRRAADREWVTQHGSSARAVAAIDAKYYADERKLAQQQQVEIEQAQAGAALPLFRGAALTQAQSDMAIGRIRGTDEDENKKSALAEAEQTHLQNELLSSAREYHEQVDDIVTASQQRQLTGFAQINAEEKRQLDELKRKFEDTYGQMDRSKPGAEDVYQKALGDYGRARAATTNGAEDERGVRSHRNAEETAQIETDARVKYLSAEKQQTAAIQAEYDDRLARLFEMLTRSEIGEEDYNRRVIAAGKARDAQMIESARQAREKMAGEFSRFFQNPTGALKEFGDRAAGEAAAALIQRLQGRLGAGMPSIGTLGAQGSFFDRIAGMPRVASQTQTAESLRMLTVGNAQISVGNANFAIAGTTLPPSQSALGAGGGSTGLLTAGGLATGSITGGEGFSSTGSTGAAMGLPAAIGGGVSGAVGYAQRGLGLFSQARSLFGSGGAASSTGGYAETTGQIIPGAFGKDGVFTSGTSGFDKSMLGGGGIKSNAAGAAGGALGLFSAFESNGGFGGAASGAMSGMQLGMSVGGPIGAAIGAAAGGVMGAIGFGGREKARVYDLKEVRPRITADITSYQQGAMDYLSAYSDLQSLDVEARKTLDKMGPAARSYYSDTVQKELRDAEGRLTGESRAGRSRYSFSAAQFDQGGWTGDFGSLATGPDSGFAHLKRDEFVVTEQPAATHAGALEAIRAGATHEDMAAYYGAGQTQLPVQPDRSQGGDIHLHAIDAKSGAEWLMKNKHVLRSAINASYAENSGSADA